MNTKYYLPVPPRVWSRYENVYNATTPTTLQLIKGNVLQHLPNKNQLTKKEKYARIANGFGPLRTKSFSTQSVTYTNPNLLYCVNKVESSVICNHCSASGVPGNSILCWDNRVKPWQPKVKTTYQMSGDKFPTGYKFLVSAIHPS